jgi:trans-aconitate 2-methyltransferase
MAAWNPERYLKFERERTLPCKDLVSRIELASPNQIVDLGCGPGNSTVVLVNRWPSASILGVDNSPEMLRSAKESGIIAKWELADIRKWEPAQKFDLVFSNAALQWVPDHAWEIPRIFNLVASGGALAFQIPTHTDLWFEALDKLVHSDPWRNRFRETASDFYSLKLDGYYDLLGDRSKKLDLWETKYFHVLAGPGDIVEWIKGTALRPMLERLPDEDSRKEFVLQCTKTMSDAYPRQKDGRLIFPFLRRFVIAYAN